MKELKEKNLGRAIDALQIVIDEKSTLDTIINWSQRVQNLLKVAPTHIISDIKDNRGNESIQGWRYLETQLLPFLEENLLN